MDVPGPVIVDSHVHLLPDRLAAAVRSFFEEHIGDQLVHPVDRGTALARLSADGVGEVWNLPYAHRPGMSEDLNAAMADITHPDVGIRNGCTVHPADPDPGKVVMRAAESHGATVLKLHCAVGEHEPDDRRLDPVYEAAARLGMPVVVHLGHGVDGRTRAHEVGPLEPAAERHPGTTFVVAHMGHPDTTATLELMHRHSNVWADLTPVMTEAVALPRDIADVSDRLLFGSDTPNTGRSIGELRSDIAHLGPTIQDQILAGNARRLFSQSA